MRRAPLILAIASFLLALAILVFARGARSLYSGLFFVVIGIVLLASARRRQGTLPGSPT